MNYFYFFFFIFLSILILIKPLMVLISDKIMAAKELKLLGLFTVVLGTFCLYVSTKDSMWFETLWKLVTFTLGLIFVIRGLIVIFYFEKIKKIIPIFIRNYFKFSVPISLAFIYLAFLIVTNDYLGNQKDISKCESDKSISVICGFQNPEDIVITPDEKFLLISEFGGIAPYGETGPGYFALLDLSNNQKIIPEITIDKNIWGEASCSRGEADAYGPHGIDIVQRDDGSYQIGVINHFPYESVEMFELSKNAESWELTWRGCISVPEELYFNDIGLKADGSFYASHMYGRDITENEWLMNSLFKSNSGHVVIWKDGDFTKVPNTEGSGPNGILLDEDSDLLYISYNQGDKISTFDLSNNTMGLDYFVQSPDNIHIDKNSLWVTSLDFQANDFGDCSEKVACSLPFSIHELDIETLELKNKTSFNKSVFGLPTVAVPIDEIIYLGSFHSDRMGYFIKK